MNKIEYVDISTEKKYQRLVCFGRLVRFLHVMQHKTDRQQVRIYFEVEPSKPSLALNLKTKLIASECEIFTTKGCGYVEKNAFYIGSIENIESEIIHIFYRKKN